eukprot:s988_g18.t1
MDDDEESPERLAALSLVRCSIAAQWARLLHRAKSFGISDPRVKSEVEFLEATVSKFAQENGSIMAFSPSPQIEDRYPRPGELVPSPQGSESSSTSPASEETWVDHEFKFLQIGNDVWTVLQVVREQDYADGYMMNLSFSELWSFKTPFYAWFSRNFESSVLPLLWEWGFTHGHATRTYPV